MKIHKILLPLLAICSTAFADNRSSLNAHRSLFNAPPDSSRTKVWWFHGETESTREGITADLEAYKEAGVGGVVYYDQVHGKAENALDAFSPEWWQMFVYAAKEAKRVGLSFETHFSNGYCTGGPWITEELGMQMLVSTDTLIKGGTHFDGTLPMAMPKKKFHGKVAVIAFPAPKCGWEKRKMNANRTIYVSDGEVNIVTDMGKPFTARSLSYNISARSRTKTRSMNVPVKVDKLTSSRVDKLNTSVTNNSSTKIEESTLMGWKHLPDIGQLQVSDDGVTWKSVVNIKPSYAGNTTWKEKTVSFPAVTGRFYRLHIHDWNLPNEKTLKLNDFTLSTAAMIDDWSVKAGLISDFIERDDTPSYTPSEIITAGSIRNISDCMDSKGRLQWQAPEGCDWVVMRFDHVATGGHTKHGRKNLMGLEADKMSAHSTMVQWQNYFKVMFDTLQHYGITIDGLHIDSHEAGAQNWTSGFEKEFHARRGYSLIDMLPVMAGYVVGDSKVSAQALRDVRRTIADLISEKHFGTIDSLSRSVGVPFTAQAIGNGLCIVGDPIQAKGKVAKPQGEFWNHHPDGGYDIKECSSAAHLYGKPIASGEAFTDVHFDTPLSYVKTLADNAYCFGLNEFVVCASASQPWLDRYPGSTGGGRHYCLNRNNTYWKYSRPFWDYQARCSYMLRQGKPVIDYCIFLGDDAPLKIRSARLPQLPEGTDFDAFTLDALMQMEVKNGRIVMPSGMSYTAMIVPTHVNVGIEASKKIEELLQQGMVMVSNVSLLSNTISDIDMVNGDMRELEVWYTHRRTDDADIYFISNHGKKAVTDTFSLRTPYTNAEWWNPIDGSITPIASHRIADGRTNVLLSLEAKEAGFVVCTGKVASHTGHKVATLTGCEVEGFKDRKVPLTTSKWNIHFSPRWGGPGTITTDNLFDWSEHPDSRIRYYSGTAIYESTFEVDKLNASVTNNSTTRLFVNLSTKDIARVWVNGNDAGIVWCSPWTLDITPFMKKGKNKLKLEVTNSWHNRMVYDASLPESERITYAYPQVVKPTDSIKPSGLLNCEITISEKNK